MSCDCAERLSLLEGIVREGLRRAIVMTKKGLKVVDVTCGKCRLWNVEPFETKNCDGGINFPCDDFISKEAIDGEG